MGKRGSIGPTKGATKSMYEAKTPDGTKTLRCGSFYTRAEVALMHIYKGTDGKWYSSSVRDTQAYPVGKDGYWVPCVKVPKKGKE